MTGLLEGQRLALKNTLADPALTPGVRRDLEQRLAETEAALCAKVSPAMTYTITTNQPGYLPNTEPYDVDDLAEARQALISELRTTYDALEFADMVDPDELEELEQMAASWDGQQPFSAMFGGYAHNADPKHLEQLGVLADE